MQTFELKNKNGMEVKVTNYGLAIISLKVPSKNGLIDIAQGFDTAEEYKNPHPFFGVIAGRYANRINKGRFILYGKEYQVDVNSNGHHLHGCFDGFDKKLWTVLESSTQFLSFSYKSPDGECGYPGELTAYCSYTLTDNNTLRIDYKAETDTKTICNLTNHSYFNLEGFESANVYSHELQINASKYTKTNEDQIPTGELPDVTGTVFDFKKPRTIGQDFDYDHNFVLDSENAGYAYSQKTGIKMSVRTSMPGMQFYMGNNLDGTVKGKGVVYNKHSGFCLETQFFPDSINHEHFPSPIVEKGIPQTSYTEYCFEVV